MVELWCGDYRAQNQHADYNLEFTTRIAGPLLHYSLNKNKRKEPGRQGEDRDICAALAQSGISPMTSLNHTVLGSSMGKIL